MTARALVLAVATLCATTSVAHAMCAEPLWIGTRQRSVIPPHGDLYLYREVPHYPPFRPRRSTGEPTRLPGGSSEFDVALDTKWIGQEGVVTQSRISPQVVKVHYEGESGSRLVIDSHWTYTLSSAWHAPYTAPRALSLHHDAGEWTCSSWDFLIIMLDQPTAAVRARWTFAGQTREWIVPARESYDGREQVALGKISCGGRTLPPNELNVGGKLELVAIRLDGTEVPITGIPTYIATGFVAQVRRYDDEELERELMRRRSVATADRQWTRGSIALALLAFAAWLARRASRARAALRYPR